MAQRQFASGDTIKWAEKFGNGSDGAGSINTSTFAEANETFTGTTGESTGTAGGTSIATNDLVFIHQTQHATDAGKWEFNKVTSGGSTSLTFKYPLCNSYSTGAQILKGKQLSGLTINTSQTLTGSSWNGSKGGITLFFVNGIAQGPGTISVSGGAGTRFTGVNTTGGGTGAGFNGGHGSQGGNTGDTINGSIGVSCKGPDFAGGATGGGGGNVAGVDAHLAGGGGGGHGAEGAEATSGTGTGNVDGAGGEAVGNAALTLIDLGSGGGGGADHWSDPQNHAVGGGGSGAGAVIIIAKEIKNTLTITATGGAGAGGSSPWTAPGGGGAGGSILLKGQKIALGNGLITSNGGSGGISEYGDGGAGGVGRIHIDYLTSLTGTTTPTLDSTQDTTLKTGAGGAFIYQML